jgi:FKBP-type peptidyl-prolyl cis-trans isomerase
MKPMRVAAEKDRVKVEYEGRLADGKSFDKSDGAEFPLDRE